MNGYEFVLPRSFHPTDYLPLRLATRADDARWLISAIVRQFGGGCQGQIPLAIHETVDYGIRYAGPLGDPIERQTAVLDGLLELVL